MSESGTTVHQRTRVPQEVPGRLAAGQRVCVNGLSSRSDLNGLHAIVGAYAAARNRYEVDRYRIIFFHLVRGCTETDDEKQNLSDSLYWSITPDCRCKWSAVRPCSH